MTGNRPATDFPPMAGRKMVVARDTPSRTGIITSLSTMTSYAGSDPLFSALASRMQEPSDRNECRRSFVKPLAGSEQKVLDVVLSQALNFVDLFDFVLGACDGFLVGEVGRPEDRLRAERLHSMGQQFLVGL